MRIENEMTVTVSISILVFPPTKNLHFIGGQRFPPPSFTDKSAKDVHFYLSENGPGEEFPVPEPLDQPGLVNAPGASPFNNTTFIIFFLWGGGMGMGMTST